MSDGEEKTRGLRSGGPIDFNAAFADISKRLERMEKANLKSLSALEKTMDKSFKTEFATFKSDVDKKISSVNKRVDNLEKDVEDNFTALDKSYELVITAPIISNPDNPRAIFNLISGVLGFDKSPEVAVFRLGSSSVAGSTTKAAPLIVKFPTIFGKDAYLQRYFMVAKDLTVQKIGVEANGSQRIYIHPNLTKKNYNIFRFALAAKADKKISKIKTVNGRIQVFIPRIKHFLTVNSMEDLKKLLSVSVDEAANST